MRGIKWYLLFSFGICWAIGGWLHFSGAYLLPNVALALSLCMLAPTLAVLLTKLITKEGWSDIGFRPRLRGHIRFYLLGWFGPPLLILAGAGLFFLCRPGTFTGAPLANPGVAVQLILSALAAPLLNIVFCTGEELGWRGYLLPRLLQHCSMRKTLLLSGLIWGVWHAPLIAMGHNYGTGYAGWPWLGILAMVVFCFACGCLFSYITLRTGSFWPAALAHGALNGMASVSLVFLADATAANPFVGPLPTGWLGGLPLLAAGLLCFFLLSRKPRPAA